MKHSDFKGLKLIEGKLTSEQKLREQIREIIKEQLNEDYKNSEWEVYVKDEKGKEKKPILWI